MDKKLCLSKDNKVLAGVCGGIAEYFNVDPTLIRIIWIIVLLSTFFTMAVLYIVCWAVMPLPPQK